MNSSRWMFLAPFLLFVSCQFLFSQTTPTEVRDAIDNVNHGQSEEVRKILPDLAAKFQNNPGILYLQGRLATDGIEAVKFYQSVVDNFPKSEWADDALYRIYQYYYSLGLYKTADLKMQQLKHDYPNSTYIANRDTTASLPVQDEPQVKLAVKDAPPPDTQRTIQPPPPAALPQTSPQANPQVKAPYTLQVGAFSTAQNAEKQKTYFEELGYNVEVSNKIRSGKSMYLVWVGSFKTAEEARSFGKQVKAKYKINSIIVERY